MSKDNFDEIADMLLRDNDIDEDEVPNLDDCSPLDPERQDLKGAFKTLASKAKSGGKKLKEKYGELKEKKATEEARQQAGERAVQEAKEKREKKQRLLEDLSRQEKLKQLEKQEKELEQKKKIQEKKENLEQERKEVQTGEMEGGGVLDAIGDFLSSRGARKRASRAREGKVDQEDKWAVVYHPKAAVVATFHYKTDAKDYASSQGKEYSVLKTETALKRGYRISGGKAFDVFGGSGGEGMDEVASFVLGSGQGGGKRSNRRGQDELNQIMKDVIGV